jgi:hypothetical protein
LPNLEAAAARNLTPRSALQPSAPLQSEASTAVAVAP